MAGTRAASARPCRWGALTGLVAQAPLGALVDAVRAKRALIAGAVVIVTATCLVIPFAPRFWPVAMAGLVGALAGVTIGPTLASISLGVVGPDRFARRAGRNEALFHLGDGSLSLFIFLTAPLWGSPVLFLSMVFTALATCVAAAAVPARAIDHEVARGLLPDAGPREAQPSAWSLLFSSRPAHHLRGLRRALPPRQRLDAGARLAEARARQRGPGHRAHRGVRDHGAGRDGARGGAGGRAGGRLGPQAALPSSPSRR
jgi:MFS family permease